jgi:hypothetical protein
MTSYKKNAKGKIVSFLHFLQFFFQNRMTKWQKSHPDVVRDGFLFHLR